jgi:hypothetical protein
VIGAVRRWSGRPGSWPRNVSTVHDVLMFRRGRYQVCCPCGWFPERVRSAEEAWALAWGHGGEDGPDSVVEVVANSLPDSLGEALALVGL